VETLLARRRWILKVFAGYPTFGEGAGGELVRGTADRVAGPEQPVNAHH
jgi:hypothetical protein